MLCFLSFFGCLSLCLFPPPSLSLYIYIDIVLFGPVKPELGVIPSGQENHSGSEHLNFPGGIYIYIYNSLSCRSRRMKV